MIATLGTVLHPSLAIIVVGAWLTWRGLVGEAGGERGLLRRSSSALGRAIGWRVFLVGLTLVGVGVAWFWDLRWLLFLSLGIGYVEIQEATTVIRAWKAGPLRR